MRSKNHAINTDSAEYNAMFTPDGKLDFKSRVGMKRDSDPLDLVEYKADPRDGKVEFAEHRELREMERSNYRTLGYGSDDDQDGTYNERW